MKKLLAFTLAETLIVMGIIGVVAALTLPNLNSSTGDREKVAKVKKLYSNLCDALGRAVAVYGPLEEWSDSNVTIFYNRMTEFMKLSKTDDTNKKVIIADGSSIKFEPNPYQSKYIITVDIDGDSKGKNTLGQDKFYFEASKDEMKPFNSPESEAFCDTFSKLITNRMICASTWIINYGTMDYLKINDSGVCQNGSGITVTESNPICK